jgi:hypothetical protein
MQAGKLVAGLLGMMVVAACGAPAAVIPTPLNPLAAQTSTMQSYGPGSAMTAASSGQAAYTDSAPAVATGEEPAPEATPTPASAPASTQAESPAPEPTSSAAVPIMDTGSDDDTPAPKPTLVQKAKTFLGNVVNKVKGIFGK